MSMEKRKKQEHDFSVTAFRVVQEATEGIESKPKPVIDCKARAEKLLPERRAEIAKKAALARWGK